MSNFEAPLAGAGLLRLDGATAQVPATTLVSFDNADHTAGSLNFDGQLTIGGNGNGMIEGGDYGVWQTRFGQNADSGSVASRFIRKPAVPLLLPIGQWAVSMRENFWQRQVR